MGNTHTQHRQTVYCDQDKNERKKARENVIYSLVQVYVPIYWLDVLDFHYYRDHIIFSSSYSINYACLSLIGC